MVTNTILIFAGPEVSAEQEPALVRVEGQYLLDYHISNFRRSGRTLHVVLGENGDCLLQHCRSLLSIDFVFDPNWQRGTVAHIKAALAAGGAPVLILAPHGPFTDWAALSRFEEAAESHFKASGGLCDLYVWKSSETWQLPWIVTKPGYEKLMKMTLDQNPLSHLNFLAIDPSLSPHESAPAPA